MLHIALLVPERPRASGRPHAPSHVVPGKFDMFHKGWICRWWNVDSCDLSPKEANVSLLLQAKPGVKLHMLGETVDGHDLDVLQVVHGNCVDCLSELVAQ